MLVAWIGVASQIDPDLGLAAGPRALQVFRSDGPVSEFECHTDTRCVRRR